ncbi:MAG: hypothetical protein V1823_01665 [Chloroflexota bacterium]
MFFIQAVVMPLTEKDYRTLDISLFDFAARRRFPNVFRVMLICLIYRALPVAFPRYADELREVLEKSFNRTYERNRIEGKPTPEVVKEFNEMVDMNAGHPFMKMAIRAAGMHQRFPATAKSAEKLNQRLERMYANFSTLGDDVQIVEKKAGKDMWQEIDRILRKKGKGLNEES